jgi:predicted AlkP superfamily pyrophosphatase or phosphodiesterase
MANPVVLISIAGLGAQDIKDRLHFLPNMAQLASDGTLVAEVTSVLPSLNAPAMTSATTGVYPKQHGITNQIQFTPEKLVPLPFAEYRTLQVPSIFDLTDNAKMTTAAFGWPVGAGAPVTWQLDVNAAEGFWGKQMTSTLRQSAPLFAMQMRRKFGVLNHRGQPSDEDDFLLAASVDTLEKKHPALFAVQFIELAQTRHRYGVRSQMAFDALQRLDYRIGQIREAAGSNANIILIGDAYQRNVDKIIHLNALFAEHGWVQANKKRIIQRNWRVFGQTAGTMAYVYLRDASLLKQVRDSLQQTAGISSVFEHDEIVSFGADPKAAFMVEAKAGYYFGNSAVSEVFQTVSTDEVRRAELGRYHALSGQHPDDNHTNTVMLAAGPNIVQMGRTNHEFHLVDVAPTLATLLGLWFESDIAGTTANWLLQDV